MVNELSARSGVAAIQRASVPFRRCTPSLVNFTLCFPLVLLLLVMALVMASPALGDVQERVSVNPVEVPVSVVFDCQPFVPGVTGRDRFAVIVENALPDDLTFELPEGIRSVGTWLAGANAALVLKIDHVNPHAAAADVIVHPRSLDAASQRSTIRFLSN